jgi:hypothetical protein
MPQYPGVRRPFMAKAELRIAARRVSHVVCAPRIPCEGTDARLRAEVIRPEACPETVLLSFEGTIPRRRFAF